jgi:Sybindin-like family
MVLQCLQTVTGIKFVITVAVADQLNINDTLLSSTLRDVLKEIYVLYTECVLKDPFYELEMPIRSDLFVQGVDLLIQQKYNIILQKIVTTPTTTTTGTSGTNHSMNPNAALSSSSKLLY